MENFDDRKKRHRRTANEIARPFKCSDKACNKSYGYIIILTLSSEGSLI
jgi:hypothetical protein